MTPTAANLWANLRATLEKQTKYYEKLLDLLNRKVKEIIKGDTAKISRIVKEEEKFVHEIEKLENTRIKATDACMPGLGRTATLREVLAAAPATEQKSLDQAATALKRALRAVAIKNRTVAKLIEESLKFSAYNINLLSSDRTVDNIYGSSGKIKDVEPKVIGIVNKEV
jgi:hypothetical protein